jgi:FkbH-like protein
MDPESRTAEALRLPPAVSRGLARRINRGRVELAREWARRHSAYPIYSSCVLDELGDWDTYRRVFAEPVLYALSCAVKTGRPELFHVYRAERRRFLHPQHLRAGGDDELGTMLEQDAVAFGPLLNGAGAQARMAIDALHAYGRSEPDGRTIRIGFIGDCVMPGIMTFLRPLMEHTDLRLDGHMYYFSARLGAELDTSEVEEAIERVGFDMLALSFLTFEGLPVYTALIQEANSGAANRDSLAAKCDAILSLVDRHLSTFRAKTNVPILLHGCSGLPLTRVRALLPIGPTMSEGHAMVARLLNDGLRSVSDGVENVIFIDERTLVSEEGIRNASKRIVPRRKTRRAVFHQSRFEALAAAEYARVVRAFGMLGQVKALLIDFDNTLWSGVMADGEVVHNAMAQMLLKQLREAGILLVSVSKNDPKNIRWDEMLLAEDDFVLHKIGWETKAQSVIEAGQQLRLDPKSFVLVDDNPVERHLVSAAVPGLPALNPMDPATWENLRLLLRFPATRQTAEAGRRTTMYREAAKRREATSASVDYASMMRSLNLRVDWRRAMAADLDRLHELLTRTNQFNTTTIRYSTAELVGLIDAATHEVFVARLSDKFGELGIVGAVITHVDKGALWFDSVVMSCRAMGFGLESVLICRSLAAHPGVARAVGRYVRTERNNPCAELFSQHGFHQIDDEHWERRGDAELSAIPDWLDITTPEQ